MKTEFERQEMLKEIGYSSIDELFKIIPDFLKIKELKLPKALWEGELKQKLADIGTKNTSLNKTISFLGGGAYQRFIPSALETVINRSEFVTAYTPYQAELSQGTLQAIYEYQSMICFLTGMDISNASMYDGATATAEAALMAVRITNNNKILLSSALHPEYREVVKTYTNGVGIEVIEIPYSNGITDISKLNDKKFAAIIVQQPNFFGCIENLKELSAYIHDNNGLFIVVAEPVSLGLLKPPAEFGTDIAAGDGQPLGNPMALGGPHVGFLAAKKDYLRQMPGRIIGQTLDKENQTVYVMTLQTREQHIKREKATSNICSNQALNALAVTVYLALLGKEGLKEVANISLQRAHYLADNIKKIKGFSLTFDTLFFNEFVITSPIKAEKLLEKLLLKNIIGGIALDKWYKDMDNNLLVCVTEMNSKEELDYFIGALNQFSE